MKTSRSTILTGIRTNEEPTIGNFLGAYVPMVAAAHKYAGEYEINMFIPDLHSFTTPIDHSKFYQQTIQGVKYYLAAGLNADNPHVHIYRNSRVPAHAELCWILDCFTYMGEASRMTQFKDKSAGMSDQSVSVGLFNYPILMAADILLYDAKYVPLGEDQFQHLELCRDVGARLNNKFGDLFTLPVSEKEQSAFMGRKDGLRIRSLTEPDKKMSKSSTSDKSKISLSDDPEIAAKKIMSATTDSVGEINYDMKNQIGISNLLQIESLLTSRPLDEVITEWTGQTRYGDLKHKVAATVKEFLTDFQDKLAAISDEKVEKLLADGEKYANEIADAKLKSVQKAIGLRR